MGAVANKIAQLESELKKLKASQPTPIDPAAEGRWRNEMHQAAERRMRDASAFSRDQLAAMEAACPADVAQDIVARGNIPAPSQAGASGQVTKTSSNAGLPGSRTGWAHASQFVPNDLPPGVALHPVPGVSLLDRQLSPMDKLNPERKP
jgi:hypothetical protein